MTYSDLIFAICEFVGTVAFAVSGAMVSIAKRVDLFGVLLLGMITALGGGAMRDMMLGRLPPAMLSNYSHLAAAVITALIVFCAARVFRERYLQKEAIIEQVNNVFDALGLGVFAVVGADIAISNGYAGNGFLVVFMGMTTAIGGGLLRDLLLREIPFVLKKRIYALAAICGALVYYLLWLVRAPNTVALFAGVTVTFVLRALATVFKWNLPKALP
jgi:uncharacterized membrane protein YeiH